MVVRTATALFSDLRGLDGLSEQYADEPGRLLPIVNEHLAVVVGVVTRCGGVVEKYVAGGMLATFGVRGDVPTHRERAMAAALGIVEANEALNRRRAAAWGFRLDVAVGAAAGQLVAAHVGPSERAEMGVLGDPINVASRLVARAGSGEVLLEGSVYRSLAGSVRADLLGRLVVRGRAGLVEAYRIALARAPAPLVARAA